MTDPDAGNPSAPPLNIGRTILVFALLPIVLGLDRWAYWGSRSMLPLHLRDLGLTAADYGSMLTVQGVFGAFALLIGGALAIGTGPAITLALGAVLAIAGYGVLAAAHSTAGAWIGLIVLGLAEGLAKPSAFALAAIELFHPRSHLRSMACVVLYATTNVAALVSGPTAGMVAQRAGPSAAFVSSAVLAALGALFAVMFLVLWLVLKTKSEAAPAAASPLSPSRAAIGAGILIVALAPYHVALSLQSSVAFGFARVASSAVAAARLYVVNPLAVLGASFVVLIVLLLLHLKGVKSGSLYAIGAGLCLTALAFAPMLLAKTSFAALSATELLVGAAEVLVGPFALSRVAGDLPPRFVTVAVALYQFVASIAGLVASFATGAGDFAPLLAGIMALLVLVVGIALLAAAQPLVRAFYRVEPRAA